MTNLFVQLGKVNNLSENGTLIRKISEDMGEADHIRVTVITFLFY